MNQSPLKNDKSIPDKIGSVPQPSDVVNKAEFFHMLLEIDDNTKTELLDSVKRDSEHLKTELHDAIYKMGKLILSRISKAGLSLTAAIHDSESEPPVSAHTDIQRALNTLDGIDESSHQPFKSAPRIPELSSDLHVDGLDNQTSSVPVKRQNEFKRGLEADPSPRVVNYSRSTNHLTGHSTQLHIGSVAPSGRIFASDEIEPSSPFNTTGSALHSHYQWGTHSSPLRERKVAWDSSSSFSQASNEAGAIMLP